MLGSTISRPMVRSRGRLDSPRRPTYRQSSSSIKRSSRAKSICQSTSPRRSTSCYFNPECEEFAPRTMWSLSNAFRSALKELDPIPQFRATASSAFSSNLERRWCDFSCSERMPPPAKEISRQAPKPPRPRLAYSPNILHFVIELGTFWVLGGQHSLRQLWRSYFIATR